MTPLCAPDPKFASLAPNYDVLLSDIWGVVHTALLPIRTRDALMRMRARGGIVVLITNAPRPAKAVSRQLERLHVPRETMAPSFRRVTSRAV
jgi:ribonucleotide monophosphatase NagD (HAD superfamily)